MKDELICMCPRCETKLIATKLECTDCGLVLSGSFIFSEFDYLDRAELDFLKHFLKTGGSFLKLQKERSMTYMAVKKQYEHILKKMGLIEAAHNEEVLIQMNEEDVMTNNDLKDKLEELCDNEIDFHTAGGRSVLGIAEVDSINETIKFKRSTGKVSWKCSINDIQKVCNLVSAGIIDKNYRQVDELVPTFGNYIIGLLNHIGYDW